MKRSIILGLLSLSLAFAPRAYAKDLDKESDYVVYGVGLNESQRSMVGESLSLKGDEEELFVDGSDLKRYLGYGTADSNMISSVLLKKNDSGQGIEVFIKTPENISLITEGQYINAAITAGISDADILVASPSPVTGESALVGVYKAEEARGNKLDSQRTKLAQEELELVSSLANENEGKASFDDKKLDTVIIEVKQKLADYKETEGDLAGGDQIAGFIKDSLAQVNMGDILSNNNIEVLVNYFDNYQKSSAIDSKEVAENLKILAGDISDKASSFYEENKDQIDQIGKEVKESGLWDKIVEFFNSILRSIKDAFSSEEGQTN
ncbi:MAG: DUF1002 domain-containing protein [Anaerococcus sp.]|nr:DUF1002 domain-containing protein [Anaerococcus sp.]